MKAAYETMPYNGQPDEFDLIIGEMLAGMAEPYVANIHEIAQRMGKQVNRDTPTFIRRQIEEDYLDELWRYHGQMITVTGWASEIEWSSESQAAKAVPRHCVGEQVKSSGFIFYSTVEDPTPRIAHSIALFAKDEDDPDTPKRKPGVICVEDLLELHLPDTTPEYHAQRFQYYFPDQISVLKELVFDSVRSDQVLLNLGNFFMDLNYDNELDREHVADCAAYLRSIAELEPEANYAMAIRGDALVLDENGEGTLALFNEKTERTVKITDISFRPADIRLAEFKGQQWCIPYIEATEYNAEGDRKLFLPVSSIDHMRSLRYKNGPLQSETTTELVI